MRGRLTDMQLPQQERRAAAPRRRHPSRRLTGRVGLVLGLAAAALVVILAWAAWSSYATVRIQAESHSRAVTQLVGREAERLIEAADLTLTQMAILAADTDWTDPESVAALTEQLRRFRRITPAAFRLFVFGPGGDLRATSIPNPPRGTTALGRDYFKAHVEADAGLFFGAPVKARIDDRPIFVLSRRVQLSGGAFGGIVSVSFEPEVIAAFYRSLETREGGAFTWLRPDGTPLVREPDLTPGELPQRKLRPPSEMIGKGDGEAGVRYRSPFDQVWRTSFVRRVGSYPLYVVYGISDRAILRAWVQGALPYFGLAVLTLSGFGLFAGQALSWARAEDGYRARLARLTRQLRTANRQLEHRVASRTADLSAALDHQRLLVEELDHRVKNTLATVQSIAAQTLRHEPAPEQFRRSFNGRLQALAQAHDLLSRSGWQGTGLQDVIGTLLAPHMTAGEGRVRIEAGPLIRVGPRAALILGMAIYELAANAAKYGALSAPKGQVRVSWRLHSEPLRQYLHIEWTETGGPAATPPARRGFGTSLIERGIAHELDGEVDLRFEPTGLRCAIEIPYPTR